MIFFSQNEGHNKIQPFFNFVKRMDN